MLASAAPREGAPPIRTTVPKEERRAYDMHKVIDALVDADSFFELKPLWAKELIIGFARLDGRVVGLVANNPMWNEMFTGSVFGSLSITPIAYAVTDPTSDDSVHFDQEYPFTG